MRSVTTSVTLDRTVPTAIGCLLLAIGARAIHADEIVRGDLGEKLDRHFTAAAADGFCGVVLVVKDGELAISKGYGMADREAGIPYTSETVFTVGSITKQFTAAAIMHLEMAGKLSVEDSIDKYFDDVPQDKASITIHHLLTHSSGLRDTFGPDFIPTPRDWIVKMALASKLLWEPGKRYRYSNAGYSLLGAIVEIASGTPYEPYLHENLFVPAGMHDTGYLIPDWEPKRLAHGYLKDGTDWGSIKDHRWADDGPGWNLRANGGILSTVGDLRRWHVALLGDEILSADAKAQMFTPHVLEGPGADTHYGYGWVVATTRRGTKLITHNGGNGIFFADVRRYVDEGTLIVFATSTVQSGGESHLRRILGMVFPPN